jgi:hypothetical protein
VTVPPLSSVPSVPDTGGRGPNVPVVASVLAEDGDAPDIYPDPEPDDWAGMVTGMGGRGRGRGLGFAARMGGLGSEGRLASMGLNCIVGGCKRGGGRKTYNVRCSSLFFLGVASQVSEGLFFDWLSVRVHCDHSGYQLPANGH